MCDMSLQDHPLWVLCKKLLERADNVEAKTDKMYAFVEFFDDHLESVVVAARPALVTGEEAREEAAPSPSPTLALTDEEGRLDGQGEYVDL